MVVNAASSGPAASRKPGGTASFPIASTPVGLTKSSNLKRTLFESPPSGESPEEKIKNAAEAALLCQNIAERLIAKRARSQEQTIRDKVRKESSLYGKEKVTGSSKRCSTPFRPNKPQGKDEKAKKFQEFTGSHEPVFQRENDIEDMYAALGRPVVQGVVVEEGSSSSPSIDQHHHIPNASEPASVTITPLTGGGTASVMKPKVNDSLLHKPTIHHEMNDPSDVIENANSASADLITDLTKRNAELEAKAGYSQRVLDGATAAAATNVAQQQNLAADAVRFIHATSATIESEAQTAIDRSGLEYRDRGKAIGETMISQQVHFDNMRLAAADAVEDRDRHIAEMRVVGTSELNALRSELTVKQQATDKVLSEEYDAQLSVQMARDELVVLKRSVDEAQHSEVRTATEHHAKGLQMQEVVRRLEEQHNADLQRIQEKSKVELSEQRVSHDREVVAINKRLEDMERRITVTPVPARGPEVFSTPPDVSAAPAQPSVVVAHTTASVNKPAETEQRDAKLLAYLETMNDRLSGIDQRMTDIDRKATERRAEPPTVSFNTRSSPNTIASARSVIETDLAAGSTPKVKNDTH